MAVATSGGGANAGPGREGGANAGGAPGGDGAPVRALFGRMVEAWDAGDAAAYAAIFAEDSDYVAFDGTRLRGRAANEASHRRLFETVLRRTRLRGEVESVRFLNPDVALVHAVGAVLMPWQDEISPRRASRQTLVAVRGGGGWEVAAFHNARVRPVPAPRAGSPVVRLFRLWTRLRLALKGRRRPPA